MVPHVKQELSDSQKNKAHKLTTREVVFNQLFTWFAITDGSCVLTERALPVPYIQLLMDTIILRSLMSPKDSRI